MLIFFDGRSVQLDVYIMMLYCKSDKVNLVDGCSVSEVHKR